MTKVELTVTEKREILQCLEDGNRLSNVIRLHLPRITFHFLSKQEKERNNE